jgi:hypothetical protein
MAFRFFPAFICNAVLFGIGRGGTEQYRAAFLVRSMCLKGGVRRIARSTARRCPASDFAQTVAPSKTQAARAGRKAFIGLSAAPANDNDSQLKMQFKCAVVSLFL